MTNNFTVETLNRVLRYEKEKLSDTADEIEHCQIRLKHLNDTSNLLVKNIKDIEITLDKINK